MRFKQYEIVLFVGPTLVQSWQMVFTQSSSSLSRNAKFLTKYFILKRNKGIIWTIKTFGDIVWFSNVWNKKILTIQHLNSLIEIQRVNIFVNICLPTVGLTTITLSRTSRIFPFILEYTRASSTKLINWWSNRCLNKEYFRLCTIQHKS